MNGTSAAEVGERVRTFLKGVLPGAESQIDAISPETPLWNVVGSLSLLELADWVEQTFEVEVRPIDFVPDNFRTVDRIAELVMRLRAAPRAR